MPAFFLLLIMFSNFIFAGSMLLNVLAFSSDRWSQLFTRALADQIICFTLGRKTLFQVTTL